MSKMSGTGRGGLQLANGLYIMYAKHDPNDTTEGILVEQSADGHDSVILGSLCLRYDDGSLWSKTAYIDSSHPAGVWTERT